VELKRALPLKLSVAELRSRSRTSSMPAFDAKNAVCSSRKFALTLVSVLGHHDHAHQRRADEHQHH